MIQLERPTNFRDMGGYKTADDKQVKEKRLLRSGEVTKLSDQDKETLCRDYNLKTIIDFRTLEEIEKTPDDELPGVRIVHLDILNNREAAAVTQKGMREQGLGNYTDEVMEQVYEHIMLDPHAAEKYREFLDLVLAQEEGSLLFHCFAGKDRTGFAAALLYTILGVSREDIMKDYLLTNEMRKKENDQLLMMAKAGGMKDEELVNLEIALSVKASYLERAYQTADKHYGGFDIYIEKVLKVTRAEKEILKERYLV